MAGSIIRLFSGGRRFGRFWDRLEVNLHDACMAAVHLDEAPTEGSLFVRLRERFTLYPVELGRLESVTIAATADDVAGQADAEPMHQATARVSFSGSKELLQTAPVDGYRFPFPGQETKQALLLRGRLVDMDARAFTRLVEDELARLRPLLTAFRPTVAAYDKRLRERVEAKIRSF